MTLAAIGNGQGDAVAALGRRTVQLEGSGHNVHVEDPAAIAALIMVLVPAESVPPQFSATAIGLATLVGEIIGATIAPAAGGAMAEAFGLGMPLLMAAASTAVVFVAALFIQEPGNWQTRRAPEPSAVPAD